MVLARSCEPMISLPNASTMMHSFALGLAIVAGTVTAMATDSSRPALPFPAALQIGAETDYKALT